MLVKNLGNLSVACAKRNGFGEIDISSGENLGIITEKLGFRAISAVLVEYEEVWDLVVEVDLPQDPWFLIDKDLVFRIENQADAYKLNARL